MNSKKRGLTHMNQTTTISSKSIADLLNEVWELRNYDPSQSANEYQISTSPLLYGIGVASFAQIEGSARSTMLASEAALAREWSTPEEDEAWAHL